MTASLTDFWLVRFRLFFAKQDICTFSLVAFIRIDNLLAIEDIKIGMTNWTAKITIQERMQATPSLKSKTTYQKFILADSQGSRVQAIMFNEAIPIMSLKLQLYKTYLISNAEVRLIPPSFQSDGIDMQWVISTETVVEELTDEQNNLLTSEFNYTEFKDLAQFLDSTTQTVDKNTIHRCRFDVDLTDKTGTITASIFADLGENLLRFTAVEAMDYSFRIANYGTIAHQSFQNTAIEPSENLITNAAVEPSDNLITATQIGEKQCSSSTVRVCLAKKFDSEESSKNPTDGESEEYELIKEKKPRLS
ncbi:hypothetical protein ACH5RR_029212 [Cinchona calisaya]|uniref:Uncharacterized protein n=1 Tax=Cinchona calisaya TaxID=153742 RepID=A0ABD2YR00_9GENT